VQRGLQTFWRRPVRGLLLKISPGAARVTDVLAATSSRTPAEDLAAGTGSGDSSAGTTGFLNCNEIADSVIASED